MEGPIYDIRTWCRESRSWAQEPIVLLLLTLIGASLALTLALLSASLTL